MRSLFINRGFPGGSVGKESTCSAGDKEDEGLITGLGRSLEKENSNPLQHSCLGTLMDWGAWRATAHGVTKSDTTKASEHSLVLTAGNIIFTHLHSWFVFVCFFKRERQWCLKKCALSPYKWGMPPISTPSKKDRNIFFWQEFDISEVILKCPLQGI